MNQQHTKKENSAKVTVNGIDINYVKIGHGPKALLLLPGTLAYIEVTRPFYLLVDKEKYTLVIWDPPGYGYSRPPDRDFSPGHLHRDADYATGLMEALQIDKYSLLGSCSGGIIAMIMASEHVDRVERLVVWSSKAFVTERDLELYEAVRNVDAWPEDFVSHGLEECYEEKYHSDTWAAWIDSLHEVFRENGGNICREALPKIQAPTLILHGAMDNLVPVEHVVYLHGNIKNSTLEIYPDGAHCIYLMYPEKVYARLDRFLTFGQ